MEIMWISSSITGHHLIPNTIKVSNIKYLTVMQLLIHRVYYDDRLALYSYSQIKSCLHKKRYLALPMYVIAFRSRGAWERGYLQTGMLSTVNMGTPKQAHPATASIAPCIYAMVSGSSQILRRLLPAISVCSADIPSTFAKIPTKALSAVRGHFPSADGSDHFYYRLQL